jgi:hypothetical protein
MENEIQRSEPHVQDEYRKDPKEESFLNRLNQLLHEAAKRDLTTNWISYPIFFIVGAPRSGTTLLYQGMCMALDVAYPNNLVAAFWQAPTYGVLLSQKLQGWGCYTNFSSTFGRTSHISEPHEFGYFWSEHLRYREMLEQPSSHENVIDWGELRNWLCNMCHLAERSFVFKTMLTVWHIESIIREIPNSYFLWVRRDPVDTALSLLKMREQMLGSKEKWVSLKPREYSWLKSKPYWYQVAGQVLFTEKRILASLRKVPDERQLTVRYSDFCNNPNKVIQQIAALPSSTLHADLPVTANVLQTFPLHRYSRDTNSDWALVKKGFQKLESRQDL